MGRIPTFVIAIIGVVLIAGLSALMFFMVLKPKTETLAEAKDKADAEEQVAARLKRAEQDKATVTAEWLAKKAQLQALMEARSIPISFGHPAAAMVALWYEYREDLPPLIERWVESCGCTIESGASFPAPAMTPPVAPPSGFLPVPGPQGITLTISGSLSDLERLYKSLDQLPRVVTVSQLVLDGEGDNMRAQVPLKFYLLCEAPEVAAAPAPAAAPGAARPGRGPRGERPQQPEAEAPEDEATPDDMDE
jgi:Tfp pilus assembly protein PilO